MPISFSLEAIEIDHGDRDLSAAFRNGQFEIGIGEDYSNKHWYARWADINLTVEEAKMFYHWLGEKLK